jgi:hypothetical protein
LTDASLLGAPDRGGATPLPAIGKWPPCGGNCGRATRPLVGARTVWSRPLLIAPQRLWRRFDSLTQPAPRRPLRGQPRLHLCAT